MSVLLATLTVSFAPWLRTASGVNCMGKGEGAGATDKPLPAW